MREVGTDRYRPAASVELLEGFAKKVRLMAERLDQFYEVVCFGTLAENTATSLTRGDRVVVVGTAETETWADDAGAPRQTEKVTAEAVGAELRWARVKVARRHDAKGDGPQ
ncbi:MAG: single-stranded DNA-binding protein [Actinomycetota bacterium]|jgi:single-stranded DNA-binding protein|nr:single-stranded DNA-binding protein [Actinomycetota bacterium]